MFPNLTDRQKAAGFVFLVLFLSVSLISFFRSRAPNSEMVVLLNMLTPLVATLLMLYVITPEGRERPSLRSLGLTATGWRTWGLAVLLPPLILGLSYGFAWMSGLVSIGTLPGEGSGVAVALSQVVTILFTIPRVLGEEVGFRGYLLPKLQQRGTTRAVLLSGFLHGVWHLPLILLTSQYVADGNRFLTIPLFLSLLTAAGVIYGILRIHTGSIWPGTVLHAVFNGCLGLVTSVAVLDSSQAVYIVGESGVVTVILTAVVALLVLRGLRSSSAEAPSKTLDAVAGRPM